MRYSLLGNPLAQRNDKGEKVSFTALLPLALVAQVSQVTASPLTMPPMQAVANAKLSSLCTTKAHRQNIFITFIGPYVRFRVDPPPLQNILNDGEMRSFGTSMFAHPLIMKDVCDVQKYRPVTSTDPNHIDMRGRIIIHQTGMPVEDFIVMDYPSHTQSNHKVRIRNGTMIGEIEYETARFMLDNAGPCSTNREPEQIKAHCS